jgi:BirA family biotin operon repressor/biotin-[acetyl-CoA-carboxylase] ligase
VGKIAVSRRLPGISPELLTSRAPIDPKRVSTLLAEPARWQIEHVPVTGSTNADLAAAAAVAMAESATAVLRTTTVLITEEQVQGRGRAGRGWVCPAGAGLMFSVLLREPAIPADRRGWVGIALGLGIVRAISAVTGLTATLKWPNDVLIDGAKCAGILGEVAGDAVVIGSGINVTVDRADLPRADATSLWLSGARALDRERLLVAILDGFGRTIDRWVAAGGDVDASGLRGEYQRCCSTLRSRVRVELPSGQSLIGWAEDIDATGSLIVRDEQGRTAGYSAADVVHLRPQ